MAIGKQKVSKAASSKRRENLFKKADELSTLCGAGVAIVTISKKGKVSIYTNSDTIIHRYLIGKGSSKSTSFDNESLNSCRKKPSERAKKAVFEEAECKMKELTNYASIKESVEDTSIDLNLALGSKYD
ncbi:hypothetical protein DITRI_Ditri07aG0002800 [Diplodiscus trichospermus]